MPEEDEAIIRLASVLFEQAIHERATDVHIEALSDQLRVRFRVDGLLREVSDTPLSALRPLINRVKVLAGMDVGRARVRREGRFAVSVEEQRHRRPRRHPADRARRLLRAPAARP